MKPRHALRLLIPKEKMMTKIEQLLAVKDGWEYWQYCGDVFRVREGNRGWMLPEGIPANARWECSIERFQKIQEGA